jgi:hypothetical protein
VVVDEAEVARTLRSQAGVIRRQQVIDAGGTDADIERLLNSRRWTRAGLGVYVEHTGPLSWSQRAWAAVLRAGPSALSGVSALRAHGLRGHDEGGGPIEVAIAAPRRVRAGKEVRIVRLRDYERVAQTHLSPPRLRIEAALVQVASRSRTDDGAVAVLADACQERRTTTARLRAELAARDRVSRRALLEAVLDDVGQGAVSALEGRYLRQVERPHGLPKARRQLAARPLNVLQVRDVEYPTQATAVELDGRLGHEWAVGRWADLDRDLASAARGEVTLRAGWQQVLEPCRLAQIVGLVLVARGWTGRPRPCGRTCLVGH